VLIRSFIRNDGLMNEPKVGGPPGWVGRPGAGAGLRRALLFLGLRLVPGDARCCVSRLDLPLSLGSGEALGVFGQTLLPGLDQASSELIQLDVSLLQARAGLPRLLPRLTFGFTRCLNLSERIGA